MSSPDYSWQIETELEPVVLRNILNLYRPFRIQVNFASGFSTSEFGDSMRYANPVPLAKLDYFESEIEVGSHSRILDIGCNLGYYCHYFMKRGAHSATGVEIDGRLFGAACLLRSIAGLSPETYKLVQGDFGDPVTQGAAARHGPYDLILFLGSVNAIPSFPAALLALRDLLRPGGAVVLEYTAIDTNESICRYHPGGEGFPDDPSHIWTFSEAFVDGVMHMAGLAKAKRALAWGNPAVLGDYKKITSIYRLPGESLPS